jgi:hypothetical protein
MATTHSNMVVSFKAFDISRDSIVSGESWIVLGFVSGRSNWLANLLDVGNGYIAGKTGAFPSVQHGIVGPERLAFEIAMIL